MASARLFHIEELPIFERIFIERANISLPAPDPTRRSPPDQLDVVYCGRFVESKQVLSLIKALDSLAADLQIFRRFG